MDVKNTYTQAINLRKCTHTYILIAFIHYLKAFKILFIKDHTTPGCDKFRLGHLSLKL